MGKVDKITVWWGIPCKSAIPMFRSMVHDLGYDIEFISLYDLPQRRRRLGWTLPDHGSMPLTILEDDWKHFIDQRLTAGNNFHILNGIYHNERIKYCADAVLKSKQKFGVIMEAPSNLESGLKRTIKSVVAPVITPLRARKVAKSAEFVFSASGERPKAFESLGFNKGRIFPFGYFPECNLLERPLNYNETLKLLCIGYLEPFKGQDILLRAIYELKSMGVAVDCEITGFGSSEESLRKLADELGLQHNVNFAGVVSNEELINLFRESHFLIAPGYEEPWGIRINEALLAGLPVIVSDGIGAKELVECSGAGEVFASGSPRSLANAIQRAAQRHTRSLADQTIASPQNLAEQYRPLITPQSAGQFISTVLNYLENDKKNHIQTPPVPPWLNKNWRSTS